MKKTGKYIKEFLYTVIFVFGWMQLLFFVKEQFPPFGGSLLENIRRGVLRDIPWMDVLISLFSALIFSASYVVILSERLDNRISVKIRILLCSLPCVLCGGLMAYGVGLQYYLPPIKNKMIGIGAWGLSYLVSVGVYVGIFFVIAMKHQKESKRYDAALDAYKKESI